MSRYDVITNRIESALLVINQLSKMAVNHIARKDCDQDARLTHLDEDAILSAVTLISTMAHDDYCELMNMPQPSLVGGVQ